MSLGISGICSSLWSRLFGSSQNFNVTEVDEEPISLESNFSVHTQPDPINSVCGQLPCNFLMAAQAPNVQGLIFHDHGREIFGRRSQDRYSSSGFALTSISLRSGDCIDSPSSESVIDQQPRLGSSSSQHRSLQLAAMLSGMSSFSSKNIFSLFGEDRIRSFTEVDSPSTASLSQLRGLLKDANVSDTVSLLLGLNGIETSDMSSPLVNLLLSQYNLSGAANNKNLNDLVELLQKVQNKESSVDEASTQSCLRVCCSTVCGLLASSPNPIVSGIGIGGTALTELLVMAAKSQRVQKSLELCHDSCKPCCTRSCGCSSCGCDGGECGCGRFGSLLCGCTELWCFKESVREEVDLKDYANKIQQLESAVGSTTFMMGLQNLGITISDLLNGDVKNIPSPEQLENACKEAVSTIGQLMMRMTQEKWMNRFCSCMTILNQSFWKGAICSGLSGRTTMLSLEDLANRVKIVTCTGGKQEAENFNPALLLPALSCLQIKGMEEDNENNEGNGLSADQKTLLLCKLCSVLSSAVGNDRKPIWLTPKQLTEIVCVCMIMCGISIEGGPSSESEECKEFRDCILQESLDCLRDRLRCSLRTTSKTRRDIRKLVVVHESQNAFIELLLALKDPDSRESKCLLRECFSSWATKAGVVKVTEA